MPSTTDQKTYWLKGIDNETRNKALKLVLSIAEKLKDPSGVEKIIMAPDNVSLAGNLNPWDPITLSHGFPGTILLFGELDRQFPDSGFDLVAHNHLVEVQKVIEKQGVNSISMFGGLTGVAYATLYISHNYERYSRFLQVLNNFILMQLEKILNEPEKELGVHPLKYDVIQGMTGIGRYLIENTKHKENREALKKILTYFVGMSSDIEVNGEKVPGWYVSKANQLLEKDRIMFPEGNFNCGLAHGIPGPLSLMALSIQKGIEIPGQREAVRKITNWLMKWKQVDSGWPSRLSFQEVATSKISHTYPKRQGWCYGDPGVARSIYLAGKALDDTAAIRSAVGAYQDLIVEQKEEWELVSPTFCHGRAGLLQMLIRMVKDEENQFSVQSIAELVHYIEESYDPNAPFGFRDIESNGEKSHQLNKAGLLEGVTGVLLPLLSLSSVEEPWWDGAFLLS
ncbi:MAG: lanthionine synthetase C family protein [Bacillota bacterium]